MDLFYRSILFSFLFLFLSCSLSAQLEKTSFFREDASRADVYLSMPDGATSFPIVVYVDGSFNP